MHRKEEIAQRRAQLSQSKQGVLGKLLGKEFTADSHLPAAATTRPGESDLHAGQFRHRLPNNLDIVCQSRIEADHFYEDIFLNETYIQHGITIKDGDHIFDVGANIGMFTLFVHHKCKDARIFAFEPAPPLFEMLRINASLHEVNARLFNFGISNASKTSRLTFYPNSSGMSSFYADENDEKEVLKSIMVNQLRSGVDGMAELLEYSDDLFTERFKSESFTCELKTLSEVIEENKVEQIDLLKIDVQKSEADVLAGIRQSDWQRIKQIVAEVHNLEGRLEKITALLNYQGYAVVVDQDPLFKGSALYNLYSIRQ